MNWQRLHLALRNNIGLKVLALLVALLLWIYVTSTQVTAPRTGEETNFFLHREMR